MMNLKMKILNPTLKKMTLETMMYIKNGFSRPFEETQEIRNEKYQKYIHQGMSEEQAKEKAYMKTLWVFQRVFFDKYISFLWSDVYLKEDEIHNEIVDDLEYKMEGGMDINKALKRVVAKYRHKFDEFFLYDKDKVERMEAEDEDTILNGVNCFT